jgi:hypothetical protein
MDASDGSRPSKLSLARWTSGTENFLPEYTAQSNGSSIIRIQVVGVTWLRRKLRGSVVVEADGKRTGGFVKLLQGLGNPALHEPPLFLRVGWHIACPL